MNVTLVKTHGGLIPGDRDTEEWAKKVKIGSVVHSDFKQMRNYKFMKKWFALLNIGFDNWTPGEVSSKFGKVTKNFERFRHDVTILCGYYDSVIRLDGSVRIIAKSVSFQKMTEETFQDLYSKTIDVLLERVYDKTMNADKLNEIVTQYLSFA